MNKLITAIFPAILFSFLFTSCDNNKDEARDIYPCIYTKDKVVYLPVAMYSSKDVTYDRAKIEAYKEHLRVENEKKYNNNDDGIQAITPRYWGDFVFDDMIEPCNNEIIAQQVSKDSIEITNPDFIFSGVVDYWGNLTYEKGILSAVKEKNGIIYWESKDTTFIRYINIINGSYIYIIPSGDSDRRYLLRSIFDSLTPLYYVESQQQDMMGLNFFSQYKYCLYLAEDKDGIYIPYMEILYKNQGNTTSYNLNNIPLPDNQIISKIIEGDTVVLQQSRLYLSKYSKI